MSPRQGAEVSQQRWGLNPHPSARLGTPNHLAHSQPETVQHLAPISQWVLTQNLPAPQRYGSALALSSSTTGVAQGWGLFMV